MFAVVAAGSGHDRRVRPDADAIDRMNTELLVPALLLSALARRDFDLVANRGLILGAVAVALRGG